MTLELKPEIESLIQKRLASGEFSSPEEVIERALEFLATEEDWLTENRESIRFQIQDGWSEAQRGNLTEGEDVCAEMQHFKADWKKQHNRA